MKKLVDTNGNSRLRLAAVHDFYSKIFPLIEIIWVDAKWHTRVLQRLYALNNRDVSFVDCLGFEIISSNQMADAIENKSGELLKNMSSAHRHARHGPVR